MNENDFSILLSQLPFDKRDIFLSRYNASKKYTEIAALLAFFIGGYGAHKFYLGQRNLGVIYLLFIWTFIPSVLGIFEAFGMSKTIKKLNTQKALEIANEIVKIEMKEEISQPAKDLIYKLTSNFEFRQSYFDNPSKVMTEFKLSETERKSFSRIHRQTYEKLTKDILFLETFGVEKSNEDIAVNQLLNIIGDGSVFFQQNPTAELCKICNGFGEVMITTKNFFGETEETQRCVNCIGRGFSIPQDK